MHHSAQSNNGGLWLSARLDDCMSVRLLSGRKPTFEPNRQLSWPGSLVYLGLPTPLGEADQDRV